MNSRSTHNRDRDTEKPKVVKNAADVTKWTTITLVSAVLLYQRDVWVVTYVLGSIVNSAIGKMMKQVIRQPRPDGSTKGDPGMPSSHATSLSFLSVAPLVSVALHRGLRIDLQLTAAAVAAVAAGVASSWRVQAGYHTVSQVLVGWLVGTTNAVVWTALFSPPLRSVFVPLLQSINLAFGIDIFRLG